MHRILVIILTSIYFSTCFFTSSLRIERVEEVNYGFPVGCEYNECESYYNFYLVHGYSANRESELMLVMDSIACNESGNSNKHKLYGIYVVQYSKVSNLENWRVFPKDLDRESISNDLVLAYIWREGKLARRSSFRRRGFFHPNELIENELPLAICR